jgi:hypothetical protein
VISQEVVFFPFGMLMQLPFFRSQNSALLDDSGLFAFNGSNFVTMLIMMSSLLQGRMKT